MRTLGYISACFVLLGASRAEAADIATLARLLEPAFYTMNVASVCITSPGWIATQPRGPRGSAHDYGFHVKAEIMDGLDENEVTLVLRTAADEARARIREEMTRNVNGESREVEKVRLMQWCTRIGTPHISRFIEGHETGHSEFHSQITQAKRTGSI